MVDSLDAVGKFNWNVIGIIGIDGVDELMFGLFKSWTP